MAKPRQMKKSPHGKMRKRQIRPNLRPLETTVDQRLRERVMDRLLLHDDFEPRSIRIKVSNGRVYLSGIVASENLRSAFEKEAAEVNDVKEVINELKTQDEFASESTANGGM